jgi:hypothetical protein
VTTREAPASVGQRLLWLLDHYRAQDGELNVPIIWRVSGPLDREVLSRALGELLARHEALRTVLVGKGRKLTQVIHPPSPARLAYHDLSATADPEAAVRHALRAEVGERIDAAEWPVRANLWAIEPDEHTFCLNVHHLATDGLSTGLIARDIGLLYDRLSDRPAPALPPVRWQYATWAAWQQEYFDGGVAQQLTEHWRQTLTGARIPLLPWRPAGSAAAEPASPLPEQASIEAPVVAALRRYGEDLRTTLFPVALAIFYAHLYRVTGQRDLSVSSLMANRSRPEVIETVGFFVNTVVLRHELDPADTLAHLVRNTRKVVLGALKHQALPYQMLPPRLVPAHESTRAVHVNDVMFQLVDNEYEQQGFTGLRIRPVEDALGGARFPLELALVTAGHGLEALLMFSDRLLDRDWARSFLRGYVELAAVAAENPHVTIGELCGD